MKQISVKTNFTAGQLSPDLYGRGDLRIYENGARTLQNVLISPTGGVSRRSGLQHIADLVGNTRLISFEFNTEQTYLLCFSAYKLSVYKDDSLIAELDTPWAETHLQGLNWTQSADTLLIVHPDVEPQQISRNDNELWQIEPWNYYQKAGRLYCPYFNFYQHKVSIIPTGLEGTISLSADNPVFAPDHVGSRLRLNGGELKITAVTDSQHCQAQVTQKLTSTSASYDWQEQAFSKVRGYPNSVTFHQDRMVIGGSKSLPNHLWLSKSSDLFNFDIGTGLDDEAIDFAILSDQVNAITAVVSTRHLLVFTTVAEWMVSGEPLTPSGIKLNRQTNIGSYNTYSLPPQNINGATVFVSANGKQLREFLYTDVEQAYQAKDLTLLASDILRQPVDFVYHQDQSILYIILQDGTISCLTTYRSEEVTAWSKMTTQGKFVSVATIGKQLYFVVKRGRTYSLECSQPSVFVDNAILLHAAVPTLKWSGLDMYEGQNIQVVADNLLIGEFHVSRGAIELFDPAQKILVGLPYEHIVEPLPFMCNSSLPYPPKSYRLIRSIFRIINTKSLKINFGRGYVEAPLNHLFSRQRLDCDLLPQSADVVFHSLGWIRDFNRPMWSIKSSIPSAFTLLSVVNHIKTQS